MTCPGKNIKFCKDFEPIKSNVYCQNVRFWNLFWFLKWCRKSPNKAARECPKSGFLSEIQKFKHGFSTRSQSDTCGAISRPLDFELLFLGSFHPYEIGRFQLRNSTIWDPGWKLLWKKLQLVVADSPLPQKLACGPGWLPKMAQIWHKQEQVFYFLTKQWQRLPT